MREKTFAEQMAYLSAAYEAPLSRERAAVYWHQLGSLPDAAFVEAVVMRVNTSRFWPSIAELREATQIVMRKHGPVALPPPEISTEDVLRDHARRIGVDPDQYVDQYLAEQMIE